MKYTKHGFVIARFDSAGNCTTCGESWRCPGWHPPTERWHSEQGRKWYNVYNVGANYKPLRKPKIEWCIGDSGTRYAPYSVVTKSEWNLCPYTINDGGNPQPVWPAVA